MTSPADDLTAHPWFFAGIGGSGMLPLALILRGHGAEIAGSDRSRDQGRSADKFAWLERQGIRLFPQDGSGITSPEQTLVASAAVESTVPEVVRAAELGCPRMTRAELLARLFNAAPCGIAVGGTSGKSTVTGMLGWILHQEGHDPTIMNGAVMKNFLSPDAPFASARVGGGTFVSEVDESDGSIALYRPRVAVLNNVSLDHKSMEELRVLFGDFLARAGSIAVNADDPESVALVRDHWDTVRFGIDNPDADLRIPPQSIVETATGISGELHGQGYGTHVAPLPIRLNVPGRHNLMNALAAIAGAYLTSVDPHASATALASFTGLARRFDILGISPSGVTVIDDFGHNPEKVAATLATLRATPGRILAFFQPHGFGPLKQMGAELAQVLATRLGPEDETLLCDPVYFGGTVDRSVASEHVVAMIREAGGRAEHCPKRDDCADRLVALARPGDRIVVMGARDDTLTDFARGILARLK